MKIVILSGSPRKKGNSRTLVREFIRLQGWEDAGQVIAKGIVESGAIKGMSELNQAYELAKSL